jgi:predicted phage-related endonuclease
MIKDNNKDEWTAKGGTLSDKTACDEYGLTRTDIIKAINEGQLHFREGNIYGNPYFRLLRSEVESLYKKKFGNASLEKEKATTELKKINKEIRKLKTRLKELENRKKELELKMQA